MNVLLLFFALIIFKCSADDELECFKILLEQPLNQQSNDAHSGKCLKVIRKHSKEFKSNVATRLSLDSSKTCVLNVLEEHDIVQIYLKGLAQHRCHPTLEQSSYEEDVDESIDALLKAAKGVCTANDTHTQAFNHYLSHREKPSEADHDELCAIKFFVDDKIIDAAAYNIDESTLNIEGCQSFIEDLKKSFKLEGDDHPESNTFFGLSAVNAQKCVTSKFKEEKVFEKLFAFSYIINFELTQSQIENLRYDYIKWMTSSVRFLFECMKEI
ncbi:CLUMA_CG017443, isoform A [Clunio marinus]|uniref:CLUMA_CG017443, isoform A n=1 Tax=Clunio marinus TaxID=568069 RepID=A0A1J1IYW1_9DIPT|nr:CLUMA_CG017443, isoform A [Clunio marinus]